MMPSNTLSPWFHVIPIILLGIELSPMSHIASFFFFLFSKEQEKHLYFCEFVLIKIKALTSQSMHQPSSPESLSTYSLGSHQYGYTYWLGDDWYQVKHSDLLYAKVKKKITKHMYNGKLCKYHWKKSILYFVFKFVANIAWGMTWTNHQNSRARIWEGFLFFFLTLQTRSCSSDRVQFLAGNFKI